MVTRVERMIEEYGEDNVKVTIQALTIDARHIPLKLDAVQQLLDADLIYACDQHDHGYHLNPEHMWELEDVERVMCAVREHATTLGLPPRTASVK